MWLLHNTIFYFSHWPIKETKVESNWVETVEITFLNTCKFYICTFTFQVSYFVPWFASFSPRPGIKCFKKRGSISRHFIIINGCIESFYGIVNYGIGTNIFPECLWMQVEATVFLLSGVVVEENKATQEESRFFGALPCFEKKHGVNIQERKEMPLQPSPVCNQHHTIQ